MRSQVAIRNSAILPAAGWAVDCDVYPGWAARTLDSTQNNRGATSAAAIDAMIGDHRDDPGNPYTVVYKPCVGRPAAVESTTWGDLRAPVRFAGGHDAQPGGLAVRIPQAGLQEPAPALRREERAWLKTATRPL